MKVSDYIVKFFEEKGVKVIFGYMGGMITHLADSIAINGNVTFIQTYHEQSSAIAAEGYARYTENIGVAIATSGPGATNMITGIANAYFDAIPVIYITGQVNTYEYKYDKPIRQQGFQETDVVSIVKPITKYATMIDRAENIRYELEKAYYVAIKDRKGPVLLDIPMNIQRTDVNIDKLNTYKEQELDSNPVNLNLLDEVNRKIMNAKKPILLIGGGVVSSHSRDLLKKYIDLTDIPFVYSLMGKGAISEHDNKCLGLIGSYGNRCANMAVYESDLLIALGTRLDSRQTGNILSEFHPHGEIIHVNNDQNELEHNRLQNRVKINLSVEDFLEYLLEHLEDSHKQIQWENRYTYLLEMYSQKQEVLNHIPNKLPYKAIDILNSQSNEGDIFTIDIGQNQMWSAQMLKMKPNQRFFTSGGLAPMGYALPSAVGVAFANKEKKVFAICGDGGFHMAIQSLLLISQYQLKVKVIVLNNNALGMITQFQELYFENHFVGTKKEGGYLVPNIESLAHAYHLNYFCIDESNINNEEYLNEIFSYDNGIYEIIIGSETRVYPKLEYNQPFNNPSPQLK